jgi:hypothetical protein
MPLLIQRGQQQYREGGEGLCSADPYRGNINRPCDNGIRSGNNDNTQLEITAEVKLCVFD